jgi:septum formation protein
MFSKIEGDYFAILGLPLLGLLELLRAHGEVPA